MLLLALFFQLNNLKQVKIKQMKYLIFFLFLSKLCGQKLDTIDVILQEVDKKPLRTPIDAKIIRATDLIENNIYTYVWKVFLVRDTTWVELKPRSIKYIFK